MLLANWIWHPQLNPHAYHQAILARKTFSLPEAASQARLAVTADSWYRLYVNGQWINDGPCRAWPEHYQYDVIEAAEALKPGDNELLILACYWGVGNFHTRPQQAGLLAQLDVTLASGATQQILSDASWQTALAAAWIANTPKVSIQMEPQEMYDARRAAEPVYLPAAVLCPAAGGPWADLHPRDTPLLTKVPLPFHAAQQTWVQPRPPLAPFNGHVCFPAARLAHPGHIEADLNVLLAGGLAALLRLPADADLRFTLEGVSLWLDGQPAQDGACRLAAGDHLLTAFVTDPVGHNKEKVFRLENPPAGLEWINPLDARQDGAVSGAENPWAYLAFPEYALRRDDIFWPWNGPVPDLAARQAAYLAEVERLAPLLTDLAAFQAHLAGRARRLPLEEVVLWDTHWRFLTRLPLDPAQPVPALPQTFAPRPGADLELCFDLGVQSVGYYDFEIEAEAGVELDIYSVEYLTPEGQIQHTVGNRNGLTYITHAGRQHFTSAKRRAGRYIFVALRNQQAPITLHSVQLIESTYPATPLASFHCSDDRLERIWEISERTLKLCMEDTFTDCPLYEQTHWVGDARNEALYAFTTFGATDLARRCILLTAQSLARFPITGCQTPSTWDVLLPAWSFLWGISVWDYYFFSRDEAFLRQAWPFVLQNLRGAEKYCTDRDLFSGPFWNMFDWSGIDERHSTVLHNSMLLVGAVDAAARCAAALEDRFALQWLAALRARLVAALRPLWNPALAAYPDSIHADGTFSQTLSQHTSFLALLYDIAAAETQAAALQNMLTPPVGMVRVGSPFAMQYFYEALEKAGVPDRILQFIYNAYLPMLALGSTTVWETFPASDYNPQGFPTRSHCHAWSAAPLYFLPRLLLGIRQVEAGGAAYQVSPRLNGLEWAAGKIATARGPLSVSWRKEGRVLRVSILAPQGAAVEFIPNDTHAGLEIVFE